MFEHLFAIFGKSVVYARASGKLAGGAMIRCFKEGGERTKSQSPKAGCHPL